MSTLRTISLALAAAFASGAEAMPDAAATRRHIDQLVAAFTSAHRPATLGLLHDAVQLSIGFGAPAYNAGDHRACGDFYAATAAAMDADFAAAESATALGATGLADLRGAVERFRAMEDVEHRAWTMRLAFDQVGLAWAMASSHGEQLGKLGGEYFRRGDYAEAELAFAQAGRLLDEVRGEQSAELAVGLRMVPVLHGQALLELQRFAPAAADVQAHPAEIRELLAADLDLRELYGNPDDFELSMLALGRAVDDAPKDTNLRFLLGFQQWFGGQRRAAREQFAKILALEPRHAAAALFPIPDQQAVP
jgi:tetratricopeptide (TPR) repeat protein